jgi:hypothetical protein
MNTYKKYAAIGEIYICDAGIKKLESCASIVFII